MKLNLFLLLCLTGVSFTLQDIRHDYHLITTPATWKEALIYCRKKYANLATVQTDDDWERLNAEAARKGLSATGWVGLYNPVSSWHWINQSQYLNLSLAFWASGQPDNAGGNEACATINSNGTWEDYDCSEYKPFICYNATLGGFVASEHLPITSFWGALKYCRTYHTDLASARNVTLNAMLREMAILQGTSWIGLYRFTWQWLDWFWPSNLHWKPGCPNNIDHNDNCASVNNSLLVDRPCNGRFSFFCHTPYTVIKQVVKLQIQGEDNVFLPAVQSDILQQIVKKLKENGFSRDTNVTFRMQPDGNIFHKKYKDDL